MTGSENKKRAASMRHIQRQQGMQIDADLTRNIGGTDLLDKIEDGGVVWLEHVTEAGGGV